MHLIFLTWKQLAHGFVYLMSFWGNNWNTMFWFLTSKFDFRRFLWLFTCQQLLSPKSSEESQKIFCQFQIIFVQHHVHGITYILQARMHKIFTHYTTPIKLVTWTPQWSLSIRIRHYALTSHTSWCETLKGL